MSSPLSPLLDALRLLLNPAASTADVLAVTTMCEEFKRRPDACQAAFYILSNHIPEHSEVARHFAYQILLFAVQESWERLSPDEIKPFKNAGLATVGAWTLDMATEALHVKSKAVAFLVEVVKREWPQRWPELVPELLKVAGIGDTHQELVALVLTSLSDEASSTGLSGSMPSKRQSEIMQGLDAFALDLLVPFRDIIPGRLTALQSTGDRRHYLLCKAILGLFASYASWLKPAKLLELNYIPVLVTLLKIQPLQADAVPILNILACRKFGKEDSEYSFQLLQTLPPVCSELLAAPSLESFSSFQAGVATAMAEMADRSLPWLCTQYSTSKGVVLTTLNVMLSAMVAVVRFPCLTAAVSIAQSLKQLLETLHEHPELRSTLERWVPTLCLDLARVCPYDSTFLSDGEDTPTARASFLSEEFMEVFDYKSMMSAGRGKVTACLKALAVSFPEVAAPAVMQLVSEVEAVRRSPPAVAQPYSLTTQSYNDANGKLLAMDALCAPLQTLLSTSLNVELKGFVFQTLSKAVEALLMSVSLTDTPALASTQLSVLGSFHTALAFQPEGFKAVVQLLFSSLEYRPPGADEKSKQLAAAVQRGAITSLIMFARHVGTLVLSHFPECCKMLLTLMRAPATLHSQKLDILECLVLLVNAMTDPPEQMAYLKDLLAQSLMFWGLDAVTTVIASPASLFQFLVTETMTLAAAPDSDSPGKQLLHSLGTILAVGRRCKVGGLQDSSIVFEAVWPALLPSLYTLLGSIHGILSPAIRAEASKSSDFMWAFVMSPEEFHQLTGESIHPEGILPGQSMGLMMSGWLYKCRTAVCNLLTLAFQHGERGAFQPSAECTSAFALLDAAVLAPPAVSYTSFRELQQLLKNIVLPLVKNCPVPYRPALFPKVAPIVNYITNTLNFLCTQPVLDASTEAPFGSSATLDPLYVGVAPLASVGVDMELLDQVKEKVLRDGIRFAVDLVTALVDFGPDAPAAAGKPHGGSGKGKDGKPAPAAAPATHANTIGRFAVLQCPPLCNEIITFLVKGTDWNDSIAFRRITTMLIRLFRELNQVPEFVPFFAKNVFEIALNSLVSQSSWTTDSQAELLNIMSEIYFTYVASTAAGSIKSDLPNTVLAEKPFVDKKSLKALQSQFAAVGEKKRKQLFKDLIQDSIAFMIRGAPASAAGPKQRAIKNITQPLVKLKKKAAEVVVSATGLFGDDDEL